MQAKKITAALVAAAVLFSGSSVLAQEFIAYEGRNAVKEGDGGAKKTVEGVDFWSDGSPPRRYQLLGYITDRRHKSGIIGAISMSGLEKDVAAATKQNGGDAVILINSEAETIGMAGMAQGFQNNAFGVARGVQKQNSKFAVVKYLPDAPPSAAAEAVTVPVAPAAVQAVVATPAAQVAVDALTTAPAASTTSGQ